MHQNKSATYVRPFHTPQAKSSPVGYHGCENSDLSWKYRVLSWNPPAQSQTNDSRPTLRQIILNVSHVGQLMFRNHFTGLEEPGAGAKKKKKNNNNNYMNLRVVKLHVRTCKSNASAGM